MSPPIKLRALATRVLELAVPPAVASPWPTSILDEAAALLAHAVLDLQKREVPGPPILAHWSALEQQRSLAWNMRCDQNGCVVCAPYESEAPSKRQRGHHAYELGLGALRVLRDPQCRHDPWENPQCRHDPLEKPLLLLAGWVEGTKDKDHDPEVQPHARGQGRL